MSETVLQVSIPSHCEVGSTINVLFENRYYEVIVPENGPGNTIQVCIPIVSNSDQILIGKPEEEVLGEHLDEVNAFAHSDHVDGNVNNAKANSINTDPKFIAAAAVTGAVVGTLILGPIVAGAVVIGGAAVYAVHKHKKAENSSTAEGTTVDVQGNKSESEGGADIYQQMSTFGHQALGSATRAMNAGMEKAKEVDNKYHITEKTSEAVQSAANKMKAFDEEHKISENATIAANQAMNKAREIDSKYEISTSMNKAFSYGMNVFSNTVSKVSSSVNGNSNNNTSTNNTSSTSNGASR